MTYEMALKIEKSYEKIVSDISEVNLEEEELEKMKRNFEKIVDSPRDFEEIESLAGLIQVLEKRDEIGPKNIENFFVIVENDKMKHLRGKILNHSRELMRIIASEPGQIVEVPCGDFDFEFSSDVFPEEAIDLLADNLNERWKEVAEILRIDPKDIRKIDTISGKHETKIREMLRIYSTHIKCSMKRGRLLNALAQIRKNSLRCQLQNIFMNYSLK